MTPRETLQSIIELKEGDKKWPTLREEAAKQQYKTSAIGGAVGGTLMGRALHSKGALPGMVVGALTGIGARAALSPTVDKLEDKGLPIDAGIVGRLPAAAAIGAGGAVFANREKLGNAAAKLGEKYRQARRQSKFKVRNAPKRAVKLLTYSEQLDDIINFEYEEAPKGAHGWNPFKWAKQEGELAKHVRRKEKENPVSYDEVKSQYKPVKGAQRLAVGGLLGGSAAALGAAAYGHAGKSRLASVVRNNLRPVAAAAFGSGATAGAYVADRKELNDLGHRHRSGMQTLRDHVEANRVPVNTLKADVPIASTYGETARGLKNEGVGFFKRHATAWATHGIRHSKENAAFIPAGKRGIIVSPKEQSPLVIRHEAGHAKDFAHYGGERGWDRRTSEPAVHPNRDPYIHETMAPEHRAWHHAGPLDDHEKQVRDAALETYAAGGMLRRTKNFTAQEELDSIIQLAAWTRKEGKSRSGGLNEKGRKSYERENPGSDLKAPSKEAGNPRRASFCARMSGMKKKLTSSKTANDPDSRINKSLKAWNCSARDQLNTILMGVSEESSERSSLEGIAICLRKMQLFAHNAHNLATGKTFMQDHGFLSELYSAYTDAYDDVVERMIGLGQSADLAAIQRDASGAIPLAAGNPFSTILSMEKELTSELEEEIKEGASQGTINLLAGLADASEVRQYKLGQILKGSAVKLGARQQLDLILMGVDPRPRTALGEFANAEEGQPNPNHMKITYSGLAAGAAGGAAFQGGGMGLKALVEKLKAVKKK